MTSNGATEAGFTAEGPSETITPASSCCTVGICPTPQGIAWTAVEVALLVLRANDLDQPPCPTRADTESNTQSVR